ACVAWPDPAGDTTPVATEVAQPLPAIFCPAATLQANELPHVPPLPPEGLALLAYSGPQVSCLLALDTQGSTAWTVATSSSDTWQWHPQLRMLSLHHHAQSSDTLAWYEHLDGAPSGQLVMADGQMIQAFVFSPYRLQLVYSELP